MFLDLGCSSGGSLKFGANSLKLGNGFGIDINPKKVQAAQDAGLNVLLGDCTKLDEIVSHQYDFAFASHFLEHLPDLCTAKAVIKSAIKVTSKAIFIQQPAFDGLDYFQSIGVKPYYADWTGHSNMMTEEQWKEILFELIKLEQIQYATLGYRKPIENTMSDVFLPLSAPRNSKRYDAQIHGPKKNLLPLDRVYYEEIRIVLAINLDTPEYEFHTQKFLTDCNHKCSSVSDF